MDMIVLTAEEAAEIAGRSPKDRGCILSPVPLADGRFMLGAEVLDDPAHQDVREFLRVRPVLPLEKLPLFGDDEAPPPVDAARLTVRKASS